MSLIEKITEAKNEWRHKGYACKEYPAIKYILAYNYDADTGYRFLRPPQFEALEIYWYLRLKLNTPHFLDLYNHFYPQKSELLEALGIKHHQEVNTRLIDGEAIETILGDKALIKQHRLETIYESASLQYASYILALTMGAGKTLLIASIIATEFAMSLEYEEDAFMKNALVFAPDKTIIQSLREIADAPFDKILPPSDHQAFTANIKLIYTQDGAKEIGGLIEKSSYNVIVTNTQKIIPRQINRTTNGHLFYKDSIKQKEKEYYINRRLQAIASLPSIGIFSDEAHHTYGNKVGNELKRVREAINYIGNETNIICVVNTTGTPYSRRKILKDVVCWYGLQQGIKDNILKSLENSVIAYDFKYQSEEAVLQDVIRNFFDEYGYHALPNGAKAKIAFYFKNKAHLDECRAIIEQALQAKNLSPSLILRNTEDATAKELQEFSGLNDPNSQKRVILLVQKGTEGWNCPSLFATALIREVTSSNNFVLQSSTRCLRQVAGNHKPARIYLESKNQRTLIKELEENFAVTLNELSQNPQDYIHHKVIIKKPDPPKLEIVKIRKELKITRHHRANIELKYPDNIHNEDDVIHKTIYQPNLERTGELLNRMGQTERMIVQHDRLDLFMASENIARRYHLDYLSIFRQLAQLYPDGEVPKEHIFSLCEQIDKVQNEFEEIETKVVEALALIKTQDEAGNDVFQKDENGLYCHTIRYHKTNKTHILKEKEITNPQNFGFHYSPYHFDSEPEREFFKEICQSLNSKPKEIRDIYFTGGLTSEKYTDFAFEYKSAQGKFKKYYPDFVVVKKNDEFVIVEVKAKNQEAGEGTDVKIKAKAVKILEGIDRNRFKYHILYTDCPIPTHSIDKIEELIYEQTEDKVK